MHGSMLSEDPHLASLHSVVSRINFIPSRFSIDWSTLLQFTFLHHFLTFLHQLACKLVMILFFAAKLPELTHNVVKTARHNNVVVPTDKCEVTAVDSGDLDFALAKHCNERDIYVYFMQVCPHQQDFSEPVNEKIKESSDLIPPRFIQSVHGYFSCKDDHPTRINLSASWDKTTVRTWDADRPLGGGGGGEYGYIFVWILQNMRWADVLTSAIS